MLFGNISYLSKAQSLAMSEYHNEDINEMILRYRELTNAELHIASEEIFREDRSNTLIYRPL